MMSKNLILLLGFGGLILALLGVALGAVFIYSAGFIIAGKHITVLGITIWMPLVLDILPVFLIPWKLSSIIWQSPLKRLKAVALATVPIWILWKLLGEWLMAESFKYGMTAALAEDISTGLLALAMHPVVQILSIAAVAWYLITRL